MIVGACLFMFISNHATKCCSLFAFCCSVYATMRNLAKKERLLECVKGLHRDTLDILQMDVTSQQSILDVRDRVVEKRVDILGMLLSLHVLIKCCYLCVLMGLSSCSVQCRCGFDGTAGGAVFRLDEADPGGQPPRHHPDHPGFPDGHEGSGQGPHSGHRQHWRASWWGITER